jgi:hypothetical protein
MADREELLKIIERKSLVKFIAYLESGKKLNVVDDQCSNFPIMAYVNSADNLAHFSIRYATELGIDLFGKFSGFTCNTSSTFRYFLFLCKKASCAKLIASQYKSVVAQNIETDFTSYFGYECHYLNNHAGLDPDNNTDVRVNLLFSLIPQHLLRTRNEKLVSFFELFKDKMLPDTYEKWTKILMGIKND